MIKAKPRPVDRVVLLTDERLEEMFVENLRKRILPDCFLYTGAGGTKRWLELAASKEFPVVSRLTDLLETSALAVSAFFSGAVDLVSIGVGSGDKEKLLLEELMPACEINFVGVDVSARLLDEALNTVRRIDCAKTAIVARFEDIGKFERYWRGSVLLCMLGNTFCNFDPERVLRLVRKHLGPGDAFLFDCNLLPLSRTNGDAGQAFAEQVEKVYGSQVNRQFNIAPLLDRGMDPESCRFSIELKPVDTPAGSAFRTSKHVEVLEDSVISSTAGEVELAAGEVIRMGRTYKYRADQVRALLKRHHFDELGLFFNPDGDNLLALVT